MGKLYRSTTDSKLAGVCGGLAKKFGIDATIIRIIWIAAVILGGFGAILYLIMWLIMPKEDVKKEYAERMKDKLNNRNN